MNAHRTAILVLVVGALTLMSAVALAQNTRSETSEAQSQIAVSEAQFDFGRVAQGTSVSHVFWIKNIGDDSVHIQDIKPGCGCTKTPFEPKTLTTGESTHVELVFATGQFSSSVTKNAKIISDASGIIPRLLFHADVRPAMDSVDVFAVQPYKIDLDQNEDADATPNLEYPFMLKNRSDANLTFSVVSAPDGLVTIDFPAGKAVAPGGELPFKAVFDKGIADDVFTKSFTIQASDANKTRLTVPISKTMRWGPVSTSQR